MDVLKEEAQVICADVAEHAEAIGFWGEGSANRLAELWKRMGSDFQTEYKEALRLAQEFRVTTSELDELNTRSTYHFVT